MWTNQSCKPRQALSKGEKEAGNHREHDLPGEEALAIGRAAITGWFENEVENSKDRDPAQRHGKTETRNKPGCQVCFLIPICLMSGVQVVWAFALQYNQSIDISRSLCIASPHLQINAPN